MDSDPPFHETYKTLFVNSIDDEESTTKISQNNDCLVIVEERELPLIDLSRLGLDELEKEGCKKEIARAAHEWGFFQVINHGISEDILEKMRDEQVKVFKQPFHNKCREDKFLNFSVGSYRWGTPTATSLRQLSWSEAFHFPMTDISTSGAFNCNYTFTLRYFQSFLFSCFIFLFSLLCCPFSYKLVLFFLFFCKFDITNN